ncbi:hypothetical protein OESDEN_00210 [Oesophagostomum dentatum]|uniref:Myotubularin phosphatase domain-containing protein n=1 Tax=Oesophagostomum dentatum TaxID=61180 RepID=A0A0B1TRB4_OESDE|nr:hypothetical protein OESDEN_00210 [Oesophagostomum dentatum]
MRFIVIVFQVCQSYPEKVIVPKGIGDDYLRISATFRDGSRFPVLSYYHKSTKILRVFLSVVYHEMRATTYWSNKSTL